MDGGIFLLGQDKQLVKMMEQPYDAEELLQRLLADYPDLLAGDQINVAAPRHWLLVEREIGIPSVEGGSDRWALDHLLLDQDAIPTFVEVKRSSDTRIRREVVGQMLDYAANAVVHWPVERIRAQFEAACALRGDDPAVVITESFGPSTDQDRFWDTTGLNLQAGRIRLLFVADLIPPELRRIVEFLNHQMNPAEVLAVEIRQFVGHSNGQRLQTLVPRVFGQTEAAKQNKRTSGPRLTIHSIPEFLATVPDPNRPLASALCAELSATGFTPVAVTTSSGNALVRADLDGVRTAPFRLEGDYLYIDLGQRNVLLSDPRTSGEIRRLVKQAVPTHKSVSDLTKSAVFVRLDQIQPDAVRTMGEVFAFVRNALQHPGPIE